MLRRAADQGLPDACVMLGNRLLFGDGVRQNRPKAVEWFQKAAVQGCAIAQFHLGSCFARGQGVEEDHEQAIHWYRKAADHGDAEAQAALDELLEAEDDSDETLNDDAVEVGQEEIAEEAPETDSSDLGCTIGFVFLFMLAGYLGYLYVTGQWH